MKDSIVSLKHVLVRMPYIMTAAPFRRTRHSFQIHICLGLTFLLHPRHGALYEESCFSTLEDLSTFFGSKGMRQSGQRGEVTCRHGCRQSPQNLRTHTQCWQYPVYIFILKWLERLLLVLCTETDRLRQMKMQFSIRPIVGATVIERLKSFTSLESSAQDKQNMYLQFHFCH